MEVLAVRGRLTGDPWRGLLLALTISCGLLLLTRVLLGLLIQFPAPSGDSVLFASVAHYHCSTGRFETPIFPLDPSGGIRYVWHGIGHPALLSWLSPTCDVAGLYVAQTLILLATGLVIWLAVARRNGPWMASLFITIVMALQSMQGFRPETTATLLTLLAEWLRRTGRTSGWALSVSLLAWVQPTTFILYTAYAVLSTDFAELRRLRDGAVRWLAAVLALQLLLVWIYPFPLQDLLQGLASQGRTFAGRSDGSVFTYLVRSDFFPLFGLVFGMTFALAAWRSPRLLLLLPLCWFYGWRVPPTYYNLVPVVAWLMFGLLVPAADSPGPNKITSDGQGAAVRARQLLLVGAVLAALGLSQSVLRDLNSWVRFGASLEAASARYQALLARGASVCSVPHHFTLMLPADAFESAYQPRLRSCTSAPVEQRLDLLTSSMLRQRTGSQGCEAWPEKPGLPMADRLFRSDSGYGFHICSGESTGLDAPAASHVN